MELEHAIGFSGTTRGGLHVHPSGETVIYAQGGCVLIASLKDAHEQAFLRGHDDAVSCIDVSASGRFIASGQSGDNADVVVWDYESRAEVYRFQEHDGGVSIVTFSADERFLLTVGRDKKMVVWDMQTGNIVSRSGKLRQMPDCAAWGGRSRNIKGRETTSYQLATGGPAQLTHWVLDPHEGSLTSEECTLGNQVRNFTAVAFSYDEAYMLAGSSSSDFTAVHVKHKVMHSTTVCGSGGVQTIIAEMAPDNGRSREGDRIIVGCGDGSITVLESQRDGAHTCRTYTKGPVEACATMLDGSVTALQLHAVDEQSGELRLLAGTEKGTIYALSLSTPGMSYGAPPAQARVLQEAHYDKVIACSYPRESSDVFATASSDGTVRVWDVNTYRVLSSGYCQVKITGEPQCLDFTGEALFTGWQDGKIRAHEAETGEELWAIDQCHRGGVTALAVSNNRKFLVSGGEEGEVRVWEIRTREMVVNLKQHTAPVTSLKLYDNDSHVLSASRDKTIYLWDLRAEARDKGLVQRMGGINAIDLLPDHIQLISVGQEKCVGLWDLRESAPLAMVPAGEEQLCIAAYTPPEAKGDSRLTIFATAGADCVVRLWRYKDASVVAKGIGHSSQVRGVKFSPDGKQLVSVGDDGGVLVWNIFLDEIIPELAPAQAPEGAPAQ